MKKLMIALAVVAMGVAANAASFTWKATSGRLFDGLGSETANRYAGTGYLFNAGTVSQAAILAAFTSEGGVASTLTSALSSSAFSAGRAAESAAFSGPDASFNAYFVVFGKDGSGNDAIYISDVAVADYQAVGDGSVIFGQQNTYSSAGFKDAASGYSAAGWYSAASAPVPEPTSGLLMLLGMAGLALRRKRA